MTLLAVLKDLFPRFMESPIRLTNFEINFLNNARFLAGCEPGVLPGHRVAEGALSSGFPPSMAGRQPGEHR